MNEVVEYPLFHQETDESGNIVALDVIGDWPHKIFVDRNLLSEVDERWVKVTKTHIHFNLTKSQVTYKLLPPELIDHPGLLRGQLETSEIVAHE